MNKGEEMNNANEPAFAAAVMDIFNGEYVQSGLTKRELLAGMAMQGLLAGGFLKTEKCCSHGSIVSCGVTCGTVQDVATEMAEQLLIRLGEEEK